MEARRAVLGAERSMIKWLNFGDKNTMFFHASTVQRRDRNKLLRSKDLQGNWLEGQQNVMNGIKDFYTSLYIDESPNCIPQNM